MVVRCCLGHADLGCRQATCPISPACFLTAPRTVHVGACGASFICGLKVFYHSGGHHRFPADNWMFKIYFDIRCREQSEVITRIGRNVAKLCNTHLEFADYFCMPSIYGLSHCGLAMCHPVLQPVCMIPPTICIVEAFCAFQNGLHRSLSNFSCVSGICCHTCHPP
jgi:hypothetical protein